MGRQRIKRADANLGPNNVSARHMQVIVAFLANGGNKTQAMKSAGYSKATSEGNPATVFNRPEVVAEIQRQKDLLFKRYDVDSEWVVQRLAEIADGGRTMAKFKKINAKGELYWDFTGATEQDLAVISEMTTEIYMEGRDEHARPVKKVKIGQIDPKGALDSLGRHLGMFKDNVNVTGEVSLVERLQRGRDRAKARQGE